MKQVARKEKKRSPCQVIYREDRLALSRRAAEDIPEYIDMFEFGGILALKGNIDGQIRLSVGSHKLRQNIRLKKVREYVREKFNCKAGDVLTAWYRDDVLMFSRNVTEAEAKLSFSDKFKKTDINSSPPEQYSVRVRGNVTSLSGSAGALFGSRLTVYEHDEVLAFLPDDNGRLELTYEKDRRTRSIHSGELAGFIRKKYGATEIKLTGWLRDGCLFCSDKRSVARIPFENSGFVKHDFKMNTDTATVNILQNSRLLISNLGASVLGEYVDLYESGEILALVNAPEGEFMTLKCGNKTSCDITGRDLVRYIQERLNLSGNESSVMPAAIRANAVYFSKKGFDYIPSFKRFKKVDFGRVCSFHVISLTLTPTGRGRFYVSRLAREHLEGPISLYHRNGVWAFAEDAEGALKMSSSGVICISKVELLMWEELRQKSKPQFYIKINDGKVFFCNRRFRNEDSLDIKLFEKMRLDKHRESSGVQLEELTG